MTAYFQKKLGAQHYARKEYDLALAKYREAIKSVLGSTECHLVGWEKAWTNYAYLEVTQLIELLALYNNIGLLLTQRNHPGDLSNALDHYNEIEAAFEAQGYTKANERFHGWAEHNPCAVEIPVLRGKARLRKAKIYELLNSTFCSCNKKRYS